MQSRQEAAGKHLLIPSFRSGRWQTLIRAGGVRIGREEREKEKNRREKERERERDGRDTHTHTEQDVQKRRMSSAGEDRLQNDALLNRLRGSSRLRLLSMGYL